MIFSDEDDLLELDLADLSVAAAGPEIRPVREKLPEEKYLTFFLAETLFAVAADKVAEVLPPLAVTPLPRAPAWLAGIANLRGEIIAIINLVKFLGGDSEPILPTARFVLLQSSLISGAFPADRLSEIITRADSDIEPVGADEAAYLAGKFLYKSNIVHLLDTGQILSSLELDINHPV